jgi:hypothetical protein
MDSKKYFTLIYPLLDSLSKGALIRNIMGALFRILGIVFFLGGIVFFFKAVSFTPDFWFFILYLLLLCSSFISMQIWFYRAKVIFSLPDSDFTVIPVFSQLFRAIGENYALFLVTLGAGGILVLWFSNYMRELWSLMPYIPGIRLESSFTGGLIFLTATVIAAFLILLVTYFIAESVLAIVEIAINTRQLKREEPKTTDATEP